MLYRLARILHAINYQRVGKNQIPFQFRTLGAPVPNERELGVDARQFHLAADREPSSDGERQRPDFFLHAENLRQRVFRRPPQNRRGNRLHVVKEPVTHASQPLSNRFHVRPRPRHRLICDRKPVGCIGVLTDLGSKALEAGPRSFAVSCFVALEERQLWSVLSQFRTPCCTILGKFSLEERTAHYFVPLLVGLSWCFTVFLLRMVRTTWEAILPQVRK